MQTQGDAPLRLIRSFHRDAEGHWFARLECGHHQHTRHNPPWIERPWVVQNHGRAAMLGTPLACRKCADGVGPDPMPHPSPPQGI
ncbi:MAG TPA: DUF3565 domain-containing protein [Guyparkeria sp.]|nr:DUF3565 domain-containing protein [Guyparkeria sp.]